MTEKNTPMPIGISDDPSSDEDVIEDEELPIVPLDFRSQIADIITQVIKQKFEAKIQKNDTTITPQFGVELIRELADAVSSVVVSIDYDLSMARTLFFIDAINEHVDNKVAKELAEALRGMRIV